MRAGPGDDFGEVRVAQPGAELGEVRLQGPGALVLLCGRAAQRAGPPSEVDGLADILKCKPHAGNSGKRRPGRRTIGSGHVLAPPPTQSDRGFHWLPAPQGLPQGVPCPARPDGANEGTTSSLPSQPRTLRSSRAAGSHALSKRVCALSPFPHGSKLWKY